MAVLPPNHPPVDLHEHKGAKCPMSSGSHDFCPPQKGDHRSVCPALNTLANHGYIPRDGKNINPFNLTRGLRECYNVSIPMGLLLGWGGFVLMKRWSFRSVDLDFFDRHTVGKHVQLGVEHDASLVHRDTPEGQEFAPTQVVEPWVEQLLGDIQPPVETIPEDLAAIPPTVVLDEKDVARARVRREKLSKPLDGYHAEIARGEMALVVGIWEQTVTTTDGSTKSGAPLSLILPWIAHERLPEGWVSKRKQGLWDTIRRNTIMRKTMKSIRAEESKDSKTK
ncbi:Chloroperoxidase [Mycena floridula]|nr:Chloroperoxidase [Mycena floridula]